MRRPISMQHGVDQVRIFEQNKNGLVRTAILAADFRSLGDSFGPEFRVALHKLAEFEATRLETILNAKSPTVVAVDLGGAKWTDKTLTEHLKQASIAAGNSLFDYTDYANPMTLLVNLTLSNGKVASFYFDIPTAKRQSESQATENSLMWPKQIIDLYHSVP